MELTTVEIKAYKTADGAIFRDIEEAKRHEEILKKANILCSNCIRFFDDNFALLTAQYEKFDNTFFNEEFDQFWKLRSVLEHAAYYYCEDEEAAEALMFFNRNTFGFNCFATVKPGYWDIRNDEEGPINLLEVIANAQNAMNAMKRGIKNESNS